ncbi:hypothetical protein D3C78_948450 [compost metagenome]
MRSANLLTHFIQATRERRFDHQRRYARFSDKFKTRFAQTFVPRDGDSGFLRKSARIITGFARFFEKRDTIAIIGIDVFRKLLRFERRPGAVGVQTQAQIRNRLQQQIDHHPIANRFVQTHFYFSDFLTRHRGQRFKQFIWIA